MVFVGAEPKHWCRLPSVNLSGTSYANISESELKKLFIPEDGQCVQYKTGERLQQLENYDYNVSDMLSAAESSANVSQTSCVNGFTYSKDEYKSTITSEFDLVCENKHWRTTSKSIFFGGRLVGALVFGQLSDRFGRRPMFFAGILTLLIAGGVASAAPNMYVFLPMYFLQGAAHTGAFLVGFTLSTELVGPDYRVIGGFVIQVFYDLGYVILAALAYFIREWRYLELAITLPALLFGVYWWILPESVPWLLSKGRDEEAEAIVLAAAKRNGVTLDPGVLQALKEDPALKGGDKKYTAIDCVRTKTMAIMSVTIWCNWVVNSFVFYGIALNSENLSGDPYLNFCLIGGVGIFAHLLCIVLVRPMGRRSSLVVFMCVAGLLCLGAAFIQDKRTTAMQTIVKVCVIAGKFCITSSYAIIYLWSAELFPTVVRNAGMGVASMSARIGGIFAPFVLDLRDTWLPLPLLVFGVLSIIAGLSAISLPETTKRALPQTLEDAHRRGRKRLKERSEPI
ncbi:organic cation transporter protein [Plakobranchus ocellatus]|uniref:Organic cation transporter protein n=1 Tax=Plakobranchus ocellatus TaxID=259542 RepID=A0AAV3YVC1_9GAST|nr:organic cation transporter protein [Plakobranchus ocellatus]